MSTVDIAAVGSVIDDIAIFGVVTVNESGKHFPLDFEVTRNLNA